MEDRTREILVRTNTYGSGSNSPQQTSDETIEVEIFWPEGFEPGKRAENSFHSGVWRLLPKLLHRAKVLR